MRKIKLKKVTVGLVNKYNQDFKKRYDWSDQAISELLKKFPKNGNLTDILLKVSVINDVYNTNVFATSEMAKHIFPLKIDSALKRCDPHIVSKIANITLKGKKKCFYSFATKYCHWHNQLKYPMYDQFVADLLKAYRDQSDFYKFNDEDLRNYPKFQKIFKKFMVFFKLDKFTVKEIDRFLWGYGKEVFSKKRK